MNEETFKGTWKNTKLPSLRPTKIKLETYTGDPVEVIGATLVRVKYKQQEVSLPLVVVVEGDAPACWDEAGWRKYAWTGVK